MLRRQRITTALALCILGATTGCQSLLHELQPHRLWRLNYSDSPGRTDGVYFSVDDPLTESVPASDSD